MKRGTPSHWKTSLLASRLGIARYSAVGILECFWQFCRQYIQDGEVAPIHYQAIAHACYWDGDVDVLIDALTESCAIIGKLQEANYDFERDE